MRERMLFLSAHHHYPEDFEREIRTENYLGILLERFDIDLLEYCHCDRETPYTAGPALKVHRVTRVPGQRSSLLGSLEQAAQQHYFGRCQQRLACGDHCAQPFAYIQPCIYNASLAWKLH